ncbi:MAG TPA: hypothetical protein VM737_04675 [Gemmatimonadota bacterium]|nr:hypothetical protein [Gemmatimonadota bacterium]
MIGGRIDFIGYAVSFRVYKESMGVTWFALSRDDVVVEVTTNPHGHIKFVE